MDTLTSLLKWLQQNGGIAKGIGTLLFPIQSVNQQLHPLIEKTTLIQGRREHGSPKSRTERKSTKIQREVDTEAHIKGIPMQELQSLEEDKKERTQSNDSEKSDQNSETLNLALMYVTSKKEPRGKKKCILYSHGNGEMCDQKLYRFTEILSDFTACDVVAWDYSGYGLSEGYPTEKQVLMNAEDILAWILEQGYTKSDIILLGCSVGSGATCHLAAKNREDIHNVILISAFLSVTRIVLPFAMPYYDMFNNVTCLSEYLGVSTSVFSCFRCQANPDGINRQVLLIHGRRDEVVPFKHAETLLGLTQQPENVLFLDSAGHNNVITQSVFERIARFVDAMA